MKKVGYFTLFYLVQAVIISLLTHIALEVGVSEWFAWACFGVGIICASIISLIIAEKLTK